jgi:hypothetical protein
MLEPVDVVRAEPEARDYALTLALAGRHDPATARLVLRSPSGTERTIELGPPEPQDAGRIAGAVQDGIGVIRIRNSLGDAALIAEFDALLDSMLAARAIVLDLRDTPSGGNSTVARGILGRFVDGVRPYQRHESIEELRRTGVRRIWVEYVAPRGIGYRGPVVALVGRWTGSMGEGLAIGLDAARGAPVVGRPMAGLLGALGEAELPHSKTVVRIPVERLYHVDGTPREAFAPCPLAAGNRDAGGDNELASAVAFARRLSASPGRAKSAMRHACPGPSQAPAGVARRP